MAGVRPKTPMSKAISCAGSAAAGLGAAMGTTPQNAGFTHDIPGVAGVATGLSVGNAMGSAHPADALTGRSQVQSNGKPAGASWWTNRMVAMTLSDVLRISRGSIAPPHRPASHGPHIGSPIREAGSGKRGGFLRSWTSRYSAPSGDVEI